MIQGKDNLCPYVTCKQEIDSFAPDAAKKEEVKKFNDE
jgi:hypothetical protein